MHVQRLVKPQARLERITRRWWFYLIILLLAFMPSYTAVPIAPEQVSQEIPKIIIEVLANPLLYAVPTWGMVLAKFLPLLVITALMVFRQRAGWVFNIYAAAITLLVALLQTMGMTETYGFAILTGNLLIVLVAAVFFIWEAAARVNDYSRPASELWRYWVVPFALLAWWMPLGADIKPDFSLQTLLFNEAGLTFCMILPVLLAVLTLYYPDVNGALLRAVSFIGLFTGVMNMIQEFIFFPEAWWLGVLHFPLLFISLYGLVLGLRHPSGRKEAAGVNRPKPA